MGAQDSKPELPSVAQPAWEAYAAMEQTKQRHLDFLKELSERHRDGGAHTIPERVHLDQLLKAHDAQVTAFRNAMADLMQSDLEAHGALIEYIKRFNATLGTDQRPH